jgi:hypothetical protein
VIRICISNLPATLENNQLTLEFVERDLETQKEGKYLALFDKAHSSATTVSKRSVVWKFKFEKVPPSQKSKSLVNNVSFSVICGTVCLIGGNYITVRAHGSSETKEGVWHNAIIIDCDKPGISLYYYYYSKKFFFFSFLNKEAEVKPKSEKEQHAIEPPDPQLLIPIPTNKQPHIQQIPHLNPQYVQAIIQYNKENQLVPPDTSLEQLKKLAYEEFDIPVEHQKFQYSYGRKGCTVIFIAYA